MNTAIGLMDILGGCGLAMVAAGLLGILWYASEEE